MGTRARIQFISCISKNKGCTTDSQNIAGGTKKIIRQKRGKRINKTAKEGKGKEIENNDVDREMSEKEGETRVLEIRHIPGYPRGIR